MMHLLLHGRQKSEFTSEVAYGNYQCLAVFIWMLPTHLMIVVYFSFSRLIECILFITCLLFQVGFQCFLAEALSTEVPTYIYSN